MLELPVQTANGLQLLLGKFPAKLASVHLMPRNYIVKANPFDAEKARSCGWEALMRKATASAVSRLLSGSTL